MRCDFSDAAKLLDVFPKGTHRRDRSRITTNPLCEINRIAVIQESLKTKINAKVEVP